MYIVRVIVRPFAAVVTDQPKVHGSDSEVIGALAKQGRRQ